MKRAGARECCATGMCGECKSSYAANGKPRCRKCGGALKLNLCGKTEYINCIMCGEIFAFLDDLAKPTRKKSGPLKTNKVLNG